MIEIGLDEVEPNTTIASPGTYLSPRTKDKKKKKKQQQQQQQVPNEPPPPVPRTLPPGALHDDGASDDEAAPLVDPDIESFEPEVSVSFGVCECPCDSRTTQCAVCCPHVHVHVVRSKCIR